MADDETITFQFLARQNERLLNEVLTLRDEILVQGATTRRLDVGQSAMLDELRAIRAQIARMNDRVTKLEDAK
jgi:hypothetical protein